MGKVTDLTAATALTTDDVLYVVDSPGTTPASKKVTFDNLQKSITALKPYTRHVQLVAKLDGAVANQPTPIDFGSVGGLQFATTGTKNAFCQFEVPDDWDGTDMYFEVDWLPDSGAMSGTDTVKWDISYRSIAEGESCQLGTLKTLSVTDSNDYAQYVTKHARFTLPYNDANQPLTKQDHVYVLITRDTSVANDFGGSVTVAGFEVIYTSTGAPTT